MIERSGEPTARTTPSTTSRSAGAISSSSDAASSSFSRAASAARSTAAPTVYVTLEPPLAPEYGPVAVSAETTRIWSGESPNASAAIVAKPVFTPLMSTADVTTVIVPSWFTRQTAEAGSVPPGQ